jgi:hypothetical protein
VGLPVYPVDSLVPLQTRRSDRGEELKRLVDGELIWDNYMRIKRMLEKQSIQPGPVARYPSPSGVG